MFERYSERARRVIFFARYEASILRSPWISPEHILLGAFRESWPGISPLFSGDPRTEIRNEIEGRAQLRGEPISTSVDLPLDNPAKRALAYGAEEAERVSQHWIRVEHLLAGLLREETSFAAELLVKHGCTLERIRNLLSERGNFRRFTPHASERAPIGRAAEGQVVEIHGVLWGATYIRDAVNECRRYHWEHRDWHPRDAIKERGGNKLFLYSGQPYDKNKFELVEGGWDQDHCVICWWELSESDPKDRRDAYWNGQDWLCAECFSLFFDAHKNVE